MAVGLSSHKSCHFGDISTSGFGGRIAVSGCPSMSRLFVDTFFEFAVVKNFASAARITTMVPSGALVCMSQHERKISPVSK